MNNQPKSNRVHKILNLFAGLAVALALMSQVSWGQTVSAATTLSTAATVSATQVCIASATGAVVPSTSASGSLLIIEAEAMRVTSQGVSSTCFRVRRGVEGSLAKAHSAGVAVYVLNVAVSSGDTSRPFVAGLISGVPGSYTSFTTISPASGVAGTSTSQAAGTIWFSKLLVPVSAFLTGACVRNGATVGTDKYVTALYSSEGVLLANSAVAGTTTAGASIYQCVAFTAIYAAAPGSYYVAIQTNGTTDNFFTYAAGAATTTYATGNKTGTFGTLTAITPVAAFEATKGPMMSVY